jgi:hypothetical protein
MGPSPDELMSHCTLEPQIIVSHNDDEEYDENVFSEIYKCKLR